ncbi:ribonuclease J [Alicyclobacillus tolerans]|nr:ribonuclease J [Alicyclobacillus tolerans]MCF8567591.1 ribonuclease J [Alicyclobacillus tolerans]
MECLTKREGKVSIFSLGGLGEIGKNMYCVEYQDEIIVIDSGLKFPDDDMLGVDLVIPDTSYLLENQQKVKGVFLTHGHEDHIGAIPYVFKDLRAPIYGAPLTIELVKSKLEEHNLLRDNPLYTVSSDEEIHFAHLSVSFFRTTHSIPDSIGIVVHTPLGVVIHTGDFKFDFTPVGPKAEISKISKLGQNGVLALLSDSTNSEKPGSTPSESSVRNGIEQIFDEADGRVLFATFASNVYRIQQAVEASISHNRRLCVVGRSMKKVFEISRKLGYINVPEQMIVDVQSVNRMPPSEVTILCTGSQGEPLSALSRIAQGRDKWIQISTGDTVVFSSSPIPGNTVNINRTINNLFRAGANVIYGSILDIHTSGHGHQEDLKLMLNLVKPKYFVPIHGEYRMQIQHSQLAQSVGVPAENIFIMDIGDVLEISSEDARVVEKISSGTVLVDGSGVGDVGNIVLRDRRLLAADGIIVIVVTVNMRERQLLSGPDIVTRGFVYMRDSEQLIRDAAKMIESLIQSMLAEDITSWGDWKYQISHELGKFLVEKTGRRPMVLPVIMEV